MGSCITKDTENNIINLDQKLILSTLENTPDFSMSYTQVNVKILKVYDGDTVTIAFPFENNIYKKSCRINGIDCPEIRPKNLDPLDPNAKLEKKSGILAANYLRGLILNTIVYAEFKGSDKYGRLLADLYMGNKESKDNRESIADHMISRGFGKKYNGGKKQIGEK